MHVSIAGALAVLARLGRCLFDRLAETKSERLLKPRRTEIRFCRGTKLVRLSRILSQNREYLDLAETTRRRRTAKRAPACSNRHRSRKGTQAAHPRPKGSNPARGQCPGRPDLRPMRAFQDLNFSETVDTFAKLLLEQEVCYGYGTSSIYG